MIKEFRLPDLGEGLTESEILSWKVEVGDTVSLNQVIAEVDDAGRLDARKGPRLRRGRRERRGSRSDVGRHRSGV